jgi:hypothetical protein
MNSSIPQAGPFESEADARSASLYHVEGGPDSGLSISKANLADLEAATSGLALGAYDRRILSWLAGSEPATVAVVCGLVRRAKHAAGVAIRPAELAIVLDALDVAADYKRDRADTCSECNADPADLCATCDWRLHLASEYDSLAEQLRGRS